MLAPDLMTSLGRLGQEAGTGEVSSAVAVAGQNRLLASFVSRRETWRAWQPRWLAVPVMAAALAAGAVFLWARPPLQYQTLGIAAAAGELHVPESTDHGTVRFSEGTEIDLRPRSRSRIAEVTSRGARVVLRDGALAARVIPRPAGRWFVEAGPYLVSVKGTVFDVHWQESQQQLEVALRTGNVLVTGPGLPAGVTRAPGQRLVARQRTGEVRIESGRPTTPRAEVAAPPSALPPPREAPPPVIVEPTIVAVQPTPRIRLAARSQGGRPLPWPALVASGQFEQIIAEAEAEGIGTVLDRRPVADLAALADAARYVGQLDVARRTMLAERARFAGSRQARAAAFFLGRTTEDIDGNAVAAIDWYDKYLRETPRGSFAAEALGRKMVALDRLADRPAARTIAVEYLRRYPSGAHARAARQLLQGQ